MSSPQIPPPLGMHADTLAADQHVLQLASPGGLPILACYCPRNHSGGLFIPHRGIWEIFTPIRFADFLGVLEEARIEIPFTDDAATWRSACSAEHHVAGKSTH